MEAYTLSDIIELDGEVVTGGADGDIAVISYPNDTAGVSTGKGGNTVAAHNEMGRQADLVLRVVRGCYDDKRLNSKLVQWTKRSPEFVPIVGNFTKVIAVDGGTNSDTTSLMFGIPLRRVEARENVAGDTEQAIAVYNIRFGNSDRSIA